MGYTVRLGLQQESQWGTLWGTSDPQKHDTEVVSNAAPRPREDKDDIFPK
jgi:hypothetical protein